MANIDMDPIRLEPTAPSRRSALPVTKKIRLNRPLAISCPFDEVLMRRRSAKRFSVTSLDDLSTWLYYLASIQSVQSCDLNRQRRFVGSFGALHPAHILLGRPDQTWFAYLPGEHSIGQLCVSADAAAELRTKAMQFYLAESATIVALLCDADLVATYYRNASALILRDAGVLLGHAALVASSVRIAFRILGTSGADALERLICDLPFTPMSVGLALVGGEADGSPSQST
jgi:hypothetical protein